MFFQRAEVVVGRFWLILRENHQVKASTLSLPHGGPKQCVSPASANSGETHGFGVGLGCAAIIGLQKTRQTEVLLKNGD